MGINQTQNQLEQSYEAMKRDMISFIRDRKLSTKLGTDLMMLSEWMEHQGASAYRRIEDGVDDESGALARTVLMAEIYAIGSLTIRMWSFDDPEIRAALEERFGR